jgi:hypothetical protein
MIGNKYIQELFKYPDEDTGLNQILELLKSKDIEFIESIRQPINLDLCNPKEMEYLTKISALIDYYLQINEVEVPNWLRDERLIFEKPYYHSKRISSFDKIKLLYSTPAPFSARNVFFDLNGIKRV